VLLGAGNAAGGYAVTDRMLAMFKTSGHPAGHGAHGKAGTVKSIHVKKH
jgi:NAD(P) transhydrogenase subunit alpha